jgi:hypothetical protein
MYAEEQLSGRCMNATQGTALKKASVETMSPVGILKTHAVQRINENNHVHAPQLHKRRIYVNVLLPQICHACTGRIPRKPKQHQTAPRTTHFTATCYQNSTTTADKNIEIQTKSTQEITHYTSHP